MINPSFDRHPVRKWLEQAIAYLETLPSDLHGYRDEFIERAYTLWSEPPDWVASLFLGDQETFENELEERPGEKPAVLEENLAVLRREVKEAGDDAGKLLAENLYNSLQHHYPGFGRLYP
jgi:hypothetical protein